eukprot:CAMPEP_0201560486 /NCGR_PEP_ID=MMETSP0173_2-20130828/78296_1 /ASSEMBLY_ACC=CAM_ASM_000268 /TAXON_ID=218659 /ORGANISM="Vexillifera sp., Strain DIVA3 564/2" /LENGTH=284 /DNA_ID=CAMNT_0047974939 /DNA_START=200 /DNA_END=1054 /DNA_ORIENTATION=+
MKALNVSYIQAMDIFGNTPLHVAVRFSKLSTLQSMFMTQHIQSWIRRHQTDAEGRTLVHLCVETQQMPMLAFLASQGCDVNSQDIDGNTPMHYLLRKSVGESSKRFARQLIRSSQGCDVNSQDIDGNTPMHYLLRKSVGESSKRFARQLIRFGASIAIKNKNGETPVEIHGGGEKVQQFIKQEQHEHLKHSLQNDQEGKNNPFSSIRNVVMQGGGVKGVAYAGVVVTLFGENSPLHLDQIQRFGGTSAGSISACALAVGMNAQHIKYVVNVLTILEKKIVLLFH